MVIVVILIIALLTYLTLWLIVPKGVFLYELLRLPQWIFKMRTFPRERYRVEKYKYGRHFRQYILLYAPVNRRIEKKHVIVYFHGGGWQFGSPEMFRPNAQELVRKGYAVFMPSHRRIPFYRIHKQREDAALALNKVFSIMKEKAMADKKIILGGMSSGANLAGLLTYDLQLLDQTGFDRALIKAVFLLGAPVNLHGMWSSPPLYLLAGRRSGDTFRLASPMNFLKTASDLPVLIVHPEKDGLVEYDSVAAFYQRMNELNCCNVEFHKLPDAIHTDAASWCFREKPAYGIVFSWLAKMERVGD